MADEAGKPDKIDMEDVLGPSTGRQDEPGDVELVDPGASGRRAGRTAPSPGPPAGPAGPGAAPGRHGERGEQEKYYDLWIRARADFENLRKRIEREREDEKVQAGAALVRDLLPALDNLERALAACDEESPFRDGVALIHKQLKEALARAGLQALEPLGEPFDPLFHEAVATEASDRFEPHRVLEEIQKGYTFRGRVIRPALVKVAVRPQAGAGGAAGEAGRDPADGGAPGASEES